MNGSMWCFRWRALIDGRALEARASPLAIHNVAGLLTVTLRAVGDVDALADLDLGRRGERIGILLLGEGLQPAHALAVDIVDDPRLFLDALAGRPGAFAN